MKSFTSKIFTLLFSGCIILSAATCQKDAPSNPNAPNTVAEGVVTFKLDGKEYIYDNLEAELTTDTDGSIIKLFFVFDLFNLQNTFDLIFYLPGGVNLEAKAYVFNDACDPTGFTEVCADMSLGALSSTSENGNATITISSVDYRNGGRVIGTFSGVVTEMLFNGQTVQDSNEIREGKFNVKIAE